MAERRVGGKKMKEDTEFTFVSAPEPLKKGRGYKLTQKILENQRYYGIDLSKIKTPTRKED